MGSKLNNTDRISNLETDVAKMRQENEASRIESAMQFQELMKAIKDLREESSKGGKESNIEFGNFSDSDKEEEESVKSKKGYTGNRPKDPLRDCRKLKMPTFEGEDAHGWIYKIERYFEIQEIGEKDQLRAASICMEGAALSWYRWNEGRTPCRSWEGFKRKLLDRFQDSQEGSVYEQFLNIQQSGTVREYVNKFESLAGQLPDLPEKVLESTFVKGLKPDLRAAIRVMEPETLAKAMRIAVKMDKNKSGGIGRTGGGPYPTRGGNNGLIKPSYTPPSAPTTTPGDKKTYNSGTGGQFKRLTKAELADCRAKGICFRCEGKYAPGHRCPSKALQVILVDE